MGYSKKRYVLGLALALGGCFHQAPIVIPSKEVALKLSQPIFGRDYYAAQSQFWNTSSCIRYPMSPPMVVGTLDTTFGTKLDHITSILNAFNPPYYRVHIINAVCIRNRNCGPYEIGHGYTKDSFNAAVLRKDPKIIKPFKTRVELYRALAGYFPNTQFIISPALEHDLSKPSWRVLADVTHSTFPSAILSNSPDGGIGIEPYRGAWIERHGNNPQSDSDIVSLDGADATQINITAFLSKVRSMPRVKIAMLWTSGDNCRTSQWEDPRVRKHCPSGKTFELMSHLTDVVPAPIKFSGTQCKKMLPFQSPDIWKPLSESHIAYDSRQELPVTIFKGFKSSDLTVIGSNGKSIGKLGYYSTYLDQGFRWYSGYKAGSKMSGYEFQKGGQSVSGSPYVWLQQGGTCKGPLLTGRRQGLMRDK